jgi:hypothetical protein
VVPVAETKVTAAVTPAVAEPEKAATTNGSEAKPDAEAERKGVKRKRPGTTTSGLK